MYILGSYIKDKVHGWVFEITNVKKFRLEIVWVTHFLRYMPMVRWAGEKRPSDARV